MYEDGAEKENCFSMSASVVLLGAGHEISSSLARFRTLDTLFRKHGIDNAIFRSLNLKLLNRNISRYLVIILTFFK